MSTHHKTLPRHRILGEAAELVKQVARHQQPIVLQTSDGSQAILAPFDPEQTYFWTPEWQAAEHEVDAHLSRGEYEECTTIEDFIASLKEAPDQTDTKTP
jgi:hypothetical protein